MSQRGGGRGEWRGGGGGRGQDGGRGGGRGGGGRGGDGGRGRGGDGGGPAREWRGNDGGGRGGGGRGGDGGRGGGGGGREGGGGSWGRGRGEFGGGDHGDRGRGRGGGGHFERGGERGGYRGGGRGDGPRGGRGMGGGYGRSRGLPPDFVHTLLPSYTEKDFKAIDQRRGWLNYRFETVDSVKLQEYRGPPAKEFEKKVIISVNHFPLRQFLLPSEIYHYETVMERVREPREGDSDKKDTQKPEPPGKKGKKGKGKPASPRKGPEPQPGEGAAGLPPRKLPKPLPQLVLQVLMARIRDQMKHHGIVSDLSNNIYSMKKLEGKIDLIQTVNLAEVDQTILQESDNGNIRVTITPTDLRIDTTAMAEYLNHNGSWKGMSMDIGTKTTLEQVYNAIVKSMPNFRFLPLGRSNLVAWPLQSRGDSLGEGVVNWKGVSANIAMGWKAYLNVDIANCALLEDRPVISALEEHFNGDVGSVADWRAEDFDSAKLFLRNVKVYYKLPKGKMLAGPITDVLRTSPRTTFFEYQNRQTSVLEYFQTVHGIKLQRPDGPCLELRKKSQVPAELCTIKKGQSYNRKLGENQTREMLTLAKKDPSTLEREIKNAIAGMKLGENKVLKAWGVDVSSELLKLEQTRVLAPPKLRYGPGTQENQGKGNAEITPVDGQWEIWNSNFKFFESRDIEQWGILIAGFARLDNSAISKFADQLIANGKQKGVNFKNPRYEFVDCSREIKDDQFSARRNIEMLKARFKENFYDCTLVLVIIPKKNSPIYSHVKQAAELHTGILTQCVVSQNVFKGQQATVQNILLKINSKLGGTNHVIITPPTKEHLKAIDIHRCPMLIMGADVTHPPPGTVKKIKGKDVPVPSFAAVTGSIDKTGMPFMMDIRAQTKAGRGAAEIIQELDQIVLNMLRKFEQMTRMRPRKIIYYRDGVGEGQFPDVLHSEMLAIRRACEKLQDYDGGKYEPKITFITVQKRHKTRFFYHPRPGETAQALPGTVVDTEIVHQTETDFYLLSHKGMMGTSRPTRYHVLWDDSEFSADQIQTLTYYLCYMYVRCNKSVRLPAPTYYSHWGAARAKALTDGMDDLFDNLPKLNQMMRRHEGMAAFPMHFV